MKLDRLFFYSIAAVIFAALFTACTPEEKEFDRALLIGKWQSGTLYEVYGSDGNGHTWDTGDDITEAEAQPFTWTLEQDVLTQIHIVEAGGSVPKVYTVTELTATTLSYEDDFGKTRTFTKINE